MRINCLSIIGILAGLWSCTSAPVLMSQDTLGRPSKLLVFGEFPSHAERLGLIACPRKLAVGRYEYSDSVGWGGRTALQFCFGEKDGRGFGPEAQLSRDGDSLEICLAREHGFCDEEACTTLVFFDICSSFSSRYDEIRQDAF